MSCSFCLRLSRENEIRWTCPSPWILRIISQSKYSLRRVTGRAGTLCERSSVYRLQRGTVVVVLVKHLEANLLYYDPVAACLSKMHSCTCDLRNLNWCRIFNRISTVIVSHCVCFPTGPSCQDRSAGSYQSHGGHRGKGSLPHYSQSVHVSCLRQRCLLLKNNPYLSLFYFDILFMLHLFFTWNVNFSNASFHVQTAWATP